MSAWASEVNAWASEVLEGAIPGDGEFLLLHEEAARPQHDERAWDGRRSGIADARPR